MAAIGYSLVAIMGKWIFAYHFSLSSIMAYRFSAATLFFFLICIGKKSRFSFSAFLPLFLLGLIADGLQTTTFLLAVREVGASITTILLYTFPVFVLLIHRIFYKEKLTLSHGLCLLFSFLGAFLIINPLASQTALSSLGIFYGLATSFIYAIYLTLSGKWTKNISASLSSAYLLSGASFFFFSYAVLENSLQMPTSTTQWLLIGAFTIIGTIIPLYSLIAGMQRIGVVRSTFLFTIEPIATCVFAYFLFHETLTPIKIIGSSFILLSVLLSIQPSKKPSSEKV
jgi:drug/metabolite transporter (DMT)-like permease